MQHPTSFTIFKDFTYTFSPIKKEDLGINVIKGQLKNKWGTLDYEFKVEVFNEAPFFVTNPVDKMVLQDTTINLALPTAKDPED